MRLSTPLTPRLDGDASGAGFLYQAYQHGMIFSVVVLRPDLLGGFRLPFRRLAGPLTAIQGDIVVCEVVPVGRATFTGLAVWRPEADLEAQPFGRLRLTVRGQDGHVAHEPAL